jgi:hypothetical protein
MSKTKRTTRQRGNYVVCARNDEYQASLERRKIYRTLPDKAALALGLIRVVDESGESYLYPKTLFVSIKLADTVARALTLAA